jgi:hypothetical protein
MNLIRDASSPRPAAPKPAGVAKGPFVFAFVNHGRWIGRCPFCRSALLVSFTRPLFFCAGGCYCEASGYQELPVIFPAAKNEIERLLSLRPSSVNRSWSIDETVRDLERDNRKRGIS